ncbi:hypothetical protein F511_21728 [Dorcoceras hygrometricum]|uniref:Uncharacterized protein n=1 Tax=Dorcoceras hygrometricum TaxID=472368 RepID=A0A2Z7BIH3_9LAMI|nr:hypothetical protein F511_21728 [Dorcoceras hygrometricum]
MWKALSEIVQRCLAIVIDQQIMLQTTGKLGLVLGAACARIFDRGTYLSNSCTGHGYVAYVLPEDWYLICVSILIQSVSCIRRVAKNYL